MEAEERKETTEGEEDKLKELLAKRKVARKEVAGGELAVAELSKQIGKEVRRRMRERKRKKIGKILSEFRGLRHIAGARSHGVKRGLGSVKDKDGHLKTGRQEVADAFADFYEALYASRREGAAQGGVSARAAKEVDPHRKPKGLLRCTRRRPARCRCSRAASRTRWA